MSTVDTPTDIPVDKPVDKLAANAELNQFQALTIYKRIMAEGDDSSPFSEDQVIRYGANIEPIDIEGIHGDVRERIEQKLTQVRDNGASELVILSGSPGAGKSHLLNAFRAPGRAEQGRYIFVCNSNHWHAAEFEECLLNWMLDSLLTPTDPQDSSESNGTHDTRTSLERPHLLLGKIRFLAYTALDQILAKPGLIQHYLAVGAPGAWRKIVGVFSKSKRNEVNGLVQKRDDRVFRLLQFRRFADHFCDRFLYDTHNPFHRYAACAMLRYLFPEERHQVIHWLRGQPVDDGFYKKLVARDQIDRKYKAMDVIKMLISLFTPDITQGLSGDQNSNGAAGLANEERAFFLAFDQIEGRDKLFEDPSDWMKFLAQVSELYNALPNLFVVFTMTLTQRDDLYPRMEMQFRDRISRERKLVLSNPQPQEVLELYEHRLNRWLGENRALVAEKLEQCGNRFAPFTQEGILQITRSRNLRQTLKVLDENFREELEKVAIGPQYDFLFARKKHKRQQNEEPGSSYFEAHCERLQQLLFQAREFIAQSWNLQITDTNLIQPTGKLKALEIQFQRADAPGVWLRVYIARLPHVYRKLLDDCVVLLANKQKSRNLLWMIRHGDIKFDNPRPGQITVLPKTSGDVETVIRSLLDVLQKQEEYKDPLEQSELNEVVSRELQEIYLGDLLSRVVAQLEKIAADPAEAAESEVSQHATLADS